MPLSYFRIFFRLVILGFCLIIFSILYMESDDLNARSNTKEVILYGVGDTAWSDYLEFCPAKIQDYCRFTSKEDDFAIADAVVYSSDSHEVIEDNKINLYFTRKAETPKTLLGSSFYMMSYRRDSEIYAPFGSIVHTNTTDVKLNEIWDMKDEKLTASWISSNCKTNNKRFELIKKAIDMGLKVDIFGKCGKPLRKSTYKCYPHCTDDTIKKYKFYFAFEEVNCIDYVTDEFFFSLKNYYAIPIVIERKIYELMGIPPAIFIALDDFTSIADFADYINVLSKDRSAYLSYHEWRYGMEVIIHEDGGICELCERIRNNNSLKSKRNLKEWSSFNTCNNSYASKFI